MKTALEIHWEFLPLGQNVKKGSSEVTFSDPLKVERHLEGYHMHNRDFFSMKDNAETGIVEKPGLVISSEKDVKYCLY